MPESDSNLVVISRKEAKAKGLRYYFTGKCCPKGHLSKRRVKNSACYQCIGESARAWEIRHPDRKDPLRRHKQSVWNAARYKRKKKEIGEKARRWYVANQEHCKDRQRKYYRKIYNEDKEIIRVWYRNRKGRLNNGSHTAKDIQNIRKMQHGKCAYCRTDLGKKYHVDHIVALKNGGSNKASNLQLLCKGCNLSKGTRDPIVHAQSLGLLL